MSQSNEMRSNKPDKNGSMDAGVWADLLDEDDMDAINSREKGGNDG